MWTHLTLAFLQRVSQIHRHGRWTCLDMQMQLTGRHRRTSWSASSPRMLSNLTRTRELSGFGFVGGGATLFGNVGGSQQSRCRLPPALSDTTLIFPTSEAKGL